MTADGETPPAPGAEPEETSHLPVPASPISEAQLERVIRRATDLQFRSSTTVTGRLDPAEVVRIGEEVGIEPRYVRQAMAEVQAEALVPQAEEDRGLGFRIAGPGMVQASRVVPGDVAAVEHNLATYLKERELLKAVRSRPGRSLWEPAGGLVSSMRRAMDVGGHGYQLAKAKRIHVTVDPVESGYALVTVGADISNIRDGSTGGWLGGLGLVSVGAALGLALSTGGAALAVIGAAAIVGGGGSVAVWAARADLRKKRQRFELVIQGILDRLERGEMLEPDGEPWHQKLLR